MAEGTSFFVSVALCMFACCLLAVGAWAERDRRQSESAYAMLHRLRTGPSWGPAPRKQPQKEQEEESEDDEVIVVERRRPRGREPRHVPVAMYGETSLAREPAESLPPETGAEYKTLRVVKPVMRASTENLAAAQAALATAAEYGELEVISPVWRGSVAASADSAPAKTLLY